MKQTDRVILPVKGYEGSYEVDNFGTVYSIERVIDVMSFGSIYRYHKKRSVLKQRMNDDGYMTVSLCKNGKAKTKRVHRLVAEAFLPNPNNYPIINHKDENRANNRLENIEWCSYRYNVLYNGANKRAAEKKRGRKMPEEQKIKLSRSMHLSRIERIKNDSSPFDTCQNERLIDFIGKNGSVTKKQAMDELGITHLSHRILDLRKMGYSVIREWEFNKNCNGQITRQGKYRFEVAL